MRILAALALTILLNGCVAGAIGSAGAAGFVGGWLSSPTQIVSDADTILKDDAALKRLYCDDELKKPHSLEFYTALSTYCSEIPTSLIGAVKTWTDVFNAMSKVDHP